MYVTEIIDGFSPRADNPMSAHFVRQGSQEILELATWSGGLYPCATNYYFVINPKTNKATPKNLFMVDGKLTNQISSAMIPADMEDQGKPKSWEPMVIGLADGTLSG